MSNIVDDGQSRAQKAAYDKVRSKYRQRYADRIAGSTTIARIYWRLVLELETRRELMRRFPKDAVYLEC